MKEMVIEEEERPFRDKQNAPAMPQLKINVTEVGHVFITIKWRIEKEAEGRGTETSKKRTEELRSACVRRTRKRKSIKKREEWTQRDGLRADEGREGAIHTSTVLVGFYRTWKKERERRIRFFFQLKNNKIAWDCVRVRFTQGNTLLVRISWG